jgi:hypothetical protein
LKILYTLIFAGTLLTLLLLLPALALSETASTSFTAAWQTYQNQSAQLTAFFRLHKCPAINYQLIPAYLESANRYQLDFRLLPSISIIESSCLQHYPVDSFNPFGWNSARTGFASLQSGIDFVSGQLADGHYYAQKTIDQKLRAYNPNPAYTGKVEQLMKEISNGTN